MTIQPVELGDFSVIRAICSLVLLKDCQTNPKRSKSPPITYENNKSSGLPVARKDSDSLPDDLLTQYGCQYQQQPGNARLFLYIDDSSMIRPYIEVRDDSYL